MATETDTASELETQATEPDTLPLDETVLLGTMGSKAAMAALIRSANGSVTHITVGDTLHGHDIIAIDVGRVVLTIEGTATTLVAPG